MSCVFSFILPDKHLEVEHATHPGICASHQGTQQGNHHLGILFIGKFLSWKSFIMDVFRKFHLVCVHGGDKEGDDEDVVEIEKTSEIVRPVHGVEAAEDEEQVGEEVGGEGDGEEAEGDEDNGEEGGGDVGLVAGKEAA